MFPTKGTINSLRREQLIPNEGTIHSQCGDFPFLPFCRICRSVCPRMQMRQNVVNGLQFFILVLVDAAEDEVESF